MVEFKLVFTCVDNSDIIDKCKIKLANIGFETIDLTRDKIIKQFKEDYNQIVTYDDLPSDKLNTEFLLKKLDSNCTSVSDNVDYTHLELSVREDYARKYNIFEDASIIWVEISKHALDKYLNLGYSINVTSIYNPFSWSKFKQYKINTVDLMFKFNNDNILEDWVTAGKPRKWSIN